MSVHPPPAARAAGPRIRMGQTTAVAIAYVAGMFMSTMDMHVVNVALPTLSRDFHVSLSSVQWTVLVYLLTLAVVIPASGWIGDNLGIRRTFIAALTIFTIASALCGLAQNLGQLIAARALQGIGGGILTPMGTAMLYRAFPPARRAAVARTLLVPVLVGPAAAPVLGGVFTQYVSWRWVFLVNLPVGAATIAFSLLCLARDAPSVGARLDLRGLVLCGLGLSALMYAVSEGSDAGWSSPAILASGLGGIAALGLFARVSLGSPDPVLRLALLRDRLLRGSIITAGLAIGAFLANLYLTPIFLQEMLGQSPTAAGLTTFVEAIGVGVAAQTLGRLYPRLGPRRLAGVSALMLTAVIAVFTRLGPGTSLWTVRGLMFLAGMCNSGVVLSVQTAMFTRVSRADTAQASAIYNTERQTSIAICVALLTTVVAGVRRAGGGSLTAFHAAYAVDAGLALLGALAAILLIHTEDARATMRPRH